MGSAGKATRFIFDLEKLPETIAQWEEITEYPED